MQEVYCIKNSKKMVYKLPFCVQVQRKNWIGSKDKTNYYVMSAKDVAICGYRGIILGKSMVILGVINKLSAFIV